MIVLVVMMATLVVLLPFRDPGMPMRLRKSSTASRLRGQVNRGPVIVLSVHQWLPAPI
jgi:hypothetical protein